MTEARDHGKLTARDREILRDVILTHILSAEPVSSRSVAKHGKLGLSAASIRNVMADLEEWGYLMQPHTSAGRGPTGGGSLRRRASWGRREVCAVLASMSKKTNDACW